MRIRFTRSLDISKLYLAAYDLYFLAGIFRLSFFAKYFFQYYSVIIVFCTALLTVKELVAHYFKAKDSAPFVIMIVFFLLCMPAEQSVFPPLILFAICGRDVSPQKILKHSLIAGFFALGVIIASAKLGVILNYRSNGSARTREYLGFRYPLYPMVLYCNLLSVWLFLRRQKIRLAELICLLLMALYLFKATDARLSFARCMILLLFSLVYKIRPMEAVQVKEISRVMICAFGVAAAVMLVVSFDYSSSAQWMRKLNEVLEDRLLFGKIAYQKYGLSFWGRDISFLGHGLDVFGKHEIGKYDYVDSFYVLTLIKYGILAFGIMLIFWTYAQYIAYKKNDFIGMFIFATIALHFMIDDLPKYLYFNTFWIIAGQLFFEGKPAITSPFHNKIRGQAKRGKGKITKT